MDTIEISVIIPVYNTEEFLPRCVDSVLAQTFKEYEVILVDDGSTDGSPAVCDRYAATYGNIRAFHQQNVGLSLSRRNGLHHSAGRYVFFLDSDDWIADDALERMHCAAVELAADLVSAQYKKIDVRGQVLFDASLRRDVVCRTKAEAVQQEYCTRAIGTGAVAKLIRREILGNISFPGGLAIGEEHDMVAQLLAASDTVAVLKDAVYFYYQRPGSISRSGYNEKYKNSLLNYMRLADEVGAVFPEFRGAVRALYLEFELGVITAMCRNQNFDADAIHILRSVIRDDLPSLLSNRGTRLVYKTSALLILAAPRLFIWLYSLYYRRQDAALRRGGRA